MKKTLIYMWFRNSDGETNFTVGVHKRTRKKKSKLKNNNKKKKRKNRKGKARSQLNRMIFCF